VWERPVPLLGDVTAASQRAADPTGWAFPESAREALAAVMVARRDVRRFRPDPVADDVLRRVLSAAHCAPSVGHSQPWRFLVVRDAQIRERAALLADRERLRQAALLAPDAARRLLDLQLEGIREAPLGVIVCCDRRTPAAGVLGRATFPDADLWSCACAIQNLWLGARAEGLGLGWVTLFQPEELTGLVGLPDGVVTLGWLCVGWPDERPPAPGLERAGWSRRVPLDDVLLFDRWPADEAGPAGPAAPVSHLPDGSAAGLRAPDQHAVVGARDAADRLLTPPGSLGVLDRAVDRAVALGHGSLRAGTLVLVAADHRVTEHGVSAYPVGVTREVLAASAAGQSLGVTAARAAGLAVRLVDAGVTGELVPGVSRLGCTAARGDLVAADALTPDEVRLLLEAGRRIGAEAATTGLVALGEVGVGNTTVAAALAAALLDVAPADVIGLGAGADTAMLERKRRVVEQALQRARTEHGARLRDASVALGALGGAEIAVLAGVVAGAAQAGAVIVLDGLATSIAALIAVDSTPAAAASLVAGQRSRERGHPLVLTQLGCEPLLDLRIRAGEGAGACLAAGLLIQALRVRHDTARVGY